MKCTQGHEIGVYKSAAGWYIGCFGEDGPICRISDHYKTKAQADHALEARTFWLDEPANAFCNGGRGCLPEEEFKGDLDGDEDWLQYANDISPEDCPFNGSEVCLNDCKKCMPF